MEQRGMLSLISHSWESEACHHCGSCSALLWTMESHTRLNRQRQPRPSPSPPGTKLTAMANDRLGKQSVDEKQCLSMKAAGQPQADQDNRDTATSLSNSGI